MIGIIGAMPVEIEKMVSLLESDRQTVISGITFHEGKLMGKDVVIGKCGVGIGFAAMGAEAMILSFHPDCVINIGVAGTLTNRLDIGHLAVAKIAVQHDMDTSAVGDPIGMISGINMIELPCDETLCASILRVAARLGIPAVGGTIASGDQFVSDTGRKHWIASTYGAIACEMEASGIAQICYVNRVPCAVIRSISDNAEGGCADYEQFKRIAADQSAAVLTELLKEL